MADVRDGAPGRRRKGGDWQGGWQGAGGHATLPPMEIRPTDPLQAALQGAIDSTARLTESVQALAEGNLDPAVVLDIRSAEVALAANAKVAKAADEGFRRLLDVLA